MLFVNDNVKCHVTVGEDGHAPSRPSVSVTAQQVISTDVERLVRVTAVQVCLRDDGHLGAVAV